MPTSDRFSRARLILFVFIGLLTAGVAYSLPQSKDSAASIANGLPLGPGPTPPSGAMDASPVVSGCWNIISASVVPRNSIVSGMAAISSTDVWAVGDYYNGTAGQTLIEHWDGVAWSPVPGPDPDPTRFSKLTSVAAVSPSDVWAVGYSYLPDPPEYMFAEHWDGNQWRLVPLPDLNASLSTLRSVIALGPDDVWSAGFYISNGSSPFRALVLHWDGIEWNQVTTPDSINSVRLYAIAAVSSTDIWAAGDRFDSNARFDSYTIHWDGAEWVEVANTHVCQSSQQQFLALAALSANDVWAVGNCDVGVALIEHWDGIAWSYRGLMNQGGALSSLSAVSPSDIWAVGYETAFPNAQTLIDHWDGAAWSVVPSPNVGNSDPNFLQAAVAISSTEAWAGGYSYQSEAGSQLLILRYDEPCIPPLPIPTATHSVGTVTPAPAPPPCPSEHFTDVCPNEYFYPYVQALTNDNILYGYASTPPCRNALWIPCFNPNNPSTRGQISKIVSLAANFNDPAGGQTFEDVAPGSRFYTYTERMAERRIISGYPCGGPNEPCVPPLNRPYFRTNNNVSRGQLSKIVALAFQWNDPPTGQTFEDVPPGATFYTYTVELYNRGIINGYPCGYPGEPCNPPGNRPYFRPSYNVLRGQTAKIVQLARTQPTPTLTPTLTPASTSTSTPTAAATFTVVATIPATSVATSTQPVSTDTPAPTITSTTISKDTSTSTIR